MYIDDIKMIFIFLGGLGFFLFGMNMMSDGLQKSAGERMRRLMNILTNNKLLGVLIGTLVTAIIQSSSSTTVMVIGFVNSGIMTLSQSIGVIMGANIGTTVTAWIVSLNEAGSVLKPEFFAPLLVAVGVIFKYFAGSNFRKNLGDILLGFGSLFIGLNFMSSAIEPYSSSPIFANSFVLLGSNPVFGLMVGLLVTAVIQSSSASLGILQTLAMAGSVTTSAAVYIALGQNIGTCVTALISASTASRTAKRAAVIHLLFNVIGALICLVILFPVFLFLPSLANSNISSVQISIFHTSFNVLNTIILFPVGFLLEKLSYKFIPKIKEEENEVDDVSMTIRHLDKRLLESSYSLALETLEKELLRYGQVVSRNLLESYQAITDKDRKKVNNVLKKEKQINKINAILTDYAVELSKKPLSDASHVQIDHILYTISNIERIGDHAENLAELASSMIDSNIVFHEDAFKEMQEFFNNAYAAYETSLQARREHSRVLILKSFDIEDEVDKMDKLFRANQTNRLSKGECTALNAIYYFDILSNLERVSDHSANIAEYVEQEL